MDKYGEMLRSHAAAGSSVTATRPNLGRESTRRAVNRLLVQFRRKQVGKRIARFALKMLKPRIIVVEEKWYLSQYPDPRRPSSGSPTVKAS
jgi:hypothetical protein